VAEKPFLAESTAFNLAYNEAVKGPGGAGYSVEYEGAGAIVAARRAGQSWGRNRYNASRWETRGCRPDLDPWTCPLEREMEPLVWGEYRARSLRAPVGRCVCPACGFWEALVDPSNPDGVHCSVCSAAIGGVTDFVRAWRDWLDLPLVPAGLGGGA